MAERPILFNGAMVRAILAGRKTQTRRAIRPQPYIDGSGNFCWNGIIFGQDIAGVPLARALASQNPSSRTGRVLCPFGKIGDRLWVRETTEADRDTSNAVVLSRYSADGEPVLHPKEAGAAFHGSIQHWSYSRDTRPNIHMPREMCRLVLEITDVRVERLQAISEADAWAEGISPAAEEGFRLAGVDRPADFAFRDLWTSTGGEWDSNPWVWVIEFKRIDSPQEASDA